MQRLLSGAALAEFAGRAVVAAPKGCPTTSLRCSGAPSTLPSPATQLPSHTVKFGERAATTPRQGGGTGFEFVASEAPAIGAGRLGTPLGAQKRPSTFRGDWYDRKRLILVPRPLKTLRWRGSPF